MIVPLQAVITQPDKMNRSLDRYLIISGWAADRYRRGSLLSIKTGDRWSRYSRIEQAAWHRHCRNMTVD